MMMNRSHPSFADECGFMICVFRIRQEEEEQEGGEEKRDKEEEEGSQPGAFERAECHSVASVAYLGAFHALHGS